MNQRRLFTELSHDTTYGIDYEPCDKTLPRVEYPRLSRQCRLIIDRLRRGDATNDQLAQISRKYTSRISDLRKAGYTIICLHQDHVTGETIYRLEE